MNTNLTQKSKAPMTTKKKQIVLDFPSSEVIARSDTAYATLLGSVNTDVIASVADLVSLDSRLKIVRLGAAKERHKKGERSRCFDVWRYLDHEFARNLHTTLQLRLYHRHQALGLGGIRCRWLGRGAGSGLEQGGEL
jgi:hypothetical protein